MEYDTRTDIYTCRNDKKLTADHIRHSKSKTGYVSEKTIYKCEDCGGCPYKKECIKGNHCKTPLEERTKTLQVAKTFLKYRQEDLERILSDDGILYRTNRSIQAEGSFGDSKRQDRNTFIFSEKCLIYDILKYVFSSHENGLLKCTLFTKSQNELKILLKVNHRNSKNEAVASRIFIR